MRYGVECLKVEQDLRKKKHSMTYVKSLENHIAHLEAAIEKMRSSRNSDERDNILESISVSDIEGNPALSDSSSIEPVGNSSQLPQVSGSIYPNNSLTLSSKTRAPVTDDPLEGTPRVVRMKTLSRSPLILRALSLFFKWVYPGHYTFIHRETFLSAFFEDPSTKAYYCSEELVFAIAALGAMVSDRTEELFLNAFNYYNVAKKRVLKKIFLLDDSSLVGSTSSSKLAIVQTLLCLAFFDIGNGENPTAWYLSGLAFRIAHEIGLHLNPESWSNVYEDELSHLDIEVRSRIYWGCYIADHLICVLFGRSASLRLSNSTVPETDELPDIETGIEDYLYDPKAMLSMAKPLKKLIVLSRITELFASKIFIQTESLSQRSEHLSKFNLEIYNWRMDLPDELKWSIAALRTTVDFNPTVCYVWYHYYIVLLSYNKPFIDELEHSRTIIEETIEELYWLLVAFKAKFENFQKCNIYMVYCSILAIQCIKTGAIKKDYLAELMDFLASPSLNYELAKKIMDNEVSTEVNDLFGTLSNGNDFALEYNFDFTLLNEIDTLIAGNSNSIV